MQVGIHSTLYKLPENVVEADVQTIVEQLSNDTSVDGILVRGTHALSPRLLSPRPLPWASATLAGWKGEGTD